MLLPTSSSISRRKAIQYLAIGSSSVITNPDLSSFIKEQMHKRVIPSTGEELPVVGLGTWQTFDVGSSSSERNPLKEVLKILVNHGGSVIDSSPMYGRSEKVVGDLTRQMELKGQLFEATKVWTTGKDRGISEMNESMSLMAVNKMDLMQIHNLLDWKTHIKTLRQWKEEGKIRYIGLTHYHKGAYDQIERIIKNETIDFLQINYNLAMRHAADRILPLARDKGIAVLINRPFQGGSLFSSVKNISLPEWAAEFDAKSWGQFFLKFILSHPAVNCVIPGTGKPHHMKDNVQSGLGRLPDENHQKKMIELLSA